MNADNQPAQSTCESSGRMALVKTVTLTMLLFFACTAIPFILSVHVHPFVGLVAAIVAIRAWTFLVRPMPGFVQGIISLNGLFSTVAIFVVCLMHVVEHYWR